MTISVNNNEEHKCAPPHTYVPFIFWGRVVWRGGYLAAPFIINTQHVVGTDYINLTGCHNDMVVKLRTRRIKNA